MKNVVVLSGVADASSSNGAVTKRNRNRNRLIILIFNFFTFLPFPEPRPALGPILHNLLANRLLRVGSGTVVPEVLGGIAVRPPLAAHLQIAGLGCNAPSVLDCDLSLDGLETFDSRGDGIVKGARVVGAVAQHVEAVALVIALPLLTADVEDNAGGVDGNILAVGALQLPLDDAADLSSIIEG